MACKKCGKMKCACGGMANKKKPIKRAMGGSVSAGNSGSASTGSVPPKRQAPPVKGEGMRPDPGFTRKPPGGGMTKDLPMYRGPNKPEIMEPGVRGKTLPPNIADRRNPRTGGDLPMYRGPGKPEIMEPELRGRGTGGGSVASGGGGSSVSVKKLPPNIADRRNPNRGEGIAAVKKFRKGGMIKRGKKGC